MKTQKGKKRKTRDDQDFNFNTVDNASTPYREKKRKKALLILANKAELKKNSAVTNLEESKIALLEIVKNFPIDNIAARCLKEVRVALDKYLSSELKSFAEFSEKLQEIGTNRLLQEFVKHPIFAEVQQKNLARYQTYQILLPEIMKRPLKKMQNEVIKQIYRQSIWILFARPDLFKFKGEEIFSLLQSLNCHEKTPIKDLLDREGRNLAHYVVKFMRAQEDVEINFTLLEMLLDEGVDILVGDQEDYVSLDGLFDNSIITPRTIALLDKYQVLNGENIPQQKKVDLAIWASLSCRYDLLIYLAKQGVNYNEENGEIFKHLDEDERFLVTRTFLEKLAFCQKTFNKKVEEKIFTTTLLQALKTPASDFMDNLSKKNQREGAAFCFSIKNFFKDRQSLAAPPKFIKRKILAEAFLYKKDCVSTTRNLLVTCLLENIANEVEKEQLAKPQQSAAPTGNGRQNN